METTNVTTNADTNAEFNRLYAKYYSRIENMLTYKLNGKRHVAEELANDTFVKAFQHLDNYNPDMASVYTWLFNIAKNLLIDHWRKDKSNQITNLDDFTNDNDDASFELSEAEKADVSVVSEEKLNAINQAMKNLNDFEKNIADLYFMQELQYKEICNTLNMPLGTVKGTIFRIRKKLQSNVELTKIYAK